MNCALKLGRICCSSQFHASNTLKNKRYYWSDCIWNRDVFVKDPNHNFLEWAASNGPNSPLIKHSSNNHMVSLYAHYIHQYKNYNFNNSDEFVVNIAASHPLDFDFTLPTDKSKRDHSVIIWPDGIEITGLVEEDVPMIGKYLLKEGVIDTAVLGPQLNRHATISTITDINVIMPISKKFSLGKAMRTHGWLQAAFTQKLPEKTVNYHISSELIKSNNLPTHVLVLPMDLEYHDVQSERDVVRIVSDILAGTGNQ